MKSSKSLKSMQDKYAHNGNKFMHEGEPRGSNKKPGSPAMSPGSTERNVGPGNGKRRGR